MRSGLDFSSALTATQSSNMDLHIVKKNMNASSVLLTDVKIVLKIKGTISYFSCRRFAAVCI